MIAKNIHLYNCTRRRHTLCMSFPPPLPGGDYLPTHTHTIHHAHQNDWCPPLKVECEKLFCRPLCLRLTWEASVTCGGNAKLCKEMDKKSKDPNTGK